MSTSMQRTGAMGGDAMVLAFMIADIRGYSRFSRAHGDAAAAELAKRFADLARDGVEARGGRVVELRGDEVFATFPTAAQAVQAAVELQLSCIEETERDPSRALLVGIGIDVGPAVPVEDGYRGNAINLAARLCSSAGAGQVLLTATAAEQSESLRGDIELNPSGTSTFKGFDDPVRVVEARSRSNPVPIGHPSRGESVPAELVDAAPLVGRTHEMRWLRGTWRQVRRGNGRVIAVEGPAGIGKTRLAAEIASHVQTFGAVTRYAGPGGLAAATALSALDQARSAQAPSLVVIDQLDVLGLDVIDAIEDAATDIARLPVLLLLLLRDAAVSPAMAMLVERCARTSGHRRLAGLSPAEVTDVVALYAGDAIGEAPVEMIVRASHGIPALVHERASEWARSETTRRLEAAAGFMAAARERRTADLEFANNVIGLKLGRLYAPDGTAPTRDVDEVGPYKGLASFDQDDVAWFFGREQLVGELAARIVASGALAILGASGSGKSSVVAAGLLPSLRAGLLPGSRRWTQVEMRPGEQPMTALRATLARQDDDPIAAAIDRLDEHGRLVLVVDQFEEVFTACEDEAQRREFLDVLANHAARHADRFAVVVSLRSDFYGHLAGYPALAALLADNHVLVGPLSRAELHRVVQLPAQRAGVRIESALVETLVDEAAGEPGALPLLSTALVELWQTRSGGWIRAAAYRESGGIRGAVARLAEASFAQLDEVDRAAARRVLLRLASTAEGDTETRRRVELDEFDLDRDAGARRVIDRFTADRLLTVAGSTIEVAHEALLREWPRLRGWLDEDAQGRQLRQHLTLAANGWHERGREPSELYRGARLNAVLEWAGTHSNDLNDLERTFLSASREASAAEAEKAQRTNRRLRRIVLALAAVVALAVAGGLVALHERSTARNEANRATQAALSADARRLAALSGNVTDTATANQLALASYRLDPSAETRGALLAAAERQGGSLWRLQFPSRVFQVAPTPDGSRLLVPVNGTVWIVNPVSHRRIGHFALPSPDSAFLGVAADGSHGVVQNKSRISLIAIPSGTPTRVLSTDAHGLGSMVTYGGRWLAVDTTSGNDGPHTIDVFDLRDATAPPRRIVTGPGPKALTVGRSALAVEYRNCSVDVWALGSLHRIGAVAPDPTNKAQIGVWVSPDGARVARTDPTDFTRITVYRARRPGKTGVALPAIPTGGPYSEGLAFSPDGTELAVGSVGGPLTVYRASDGAELDSFAGNSVQLFSVAWTGGPTPALYSVGLDGELIAWDISDQPRLLHETGRDYVDVRATQQTHVGLNGSTTVLMGSDPQNDDPGRPKWQLSARLPVGAVDRWPARVARQVDMSAASASSDGQYALYSYTNTKTGDNWTTLWDLRTHAVIRQLPLPRWAQRSTDGFGSLISPDGKLGYVELSPTRIGTFALPSGRYLSSFSVHFAGVTRHVLAEPWAVDPAGRLVVFGWDPNAPDNTLGLVDPSYDKLIAQADLGDRANPTAQAWSHDGRLLALGMATGTLLVFDAKTLALRAQVNSIETGIVRSVSFSPDDQTLVTTDDAGHVDFWIMPGIDREARVTIGDGRVLAWYDGRGQLVGLAPDIRHPDENLDRWFVFDSDPASLVKAACALAGGNLTPTQWQHYVGDQPYRPICSA